MDLRHLDEIEGSSVVEMGVDLTEFYMSVEWDILEVPAVRWVEYVLTLWSIFGPYWGKLKLVNYIFMKKEN